jgi:dolichyl-phosphate-mannose-protein mannosyltransferase
MRPDMKTSFAELVRSRAAAAIAVGVAVLLVYARCAYPDVAGGDSGELVAAVATGGVIHPPGYPLYALLGRLFTLLPAGTIAFRLNVFSAVCDAAAAALLFAALERWTRSPGAALGTAALFAFSPLVWTCAIRAEVFALDNLACAALLLLAVLYDERAERRYALFGAFVLGLGLSNHHTILFAGVPLAAWAIWRGRSDWVRPRSAALLGLAFAAGLLPYVYLPIAAHHASPVSWGAADTWSGFWTHVLRREYGTFRLAAPGVASGASAASTASAFAADLFAQIGWWGLPLALLGVAVCVRAGRDKPLALVLLAAPLVSVAVLALLGNLPVGDPLHHAIVGRFWQQPELFVCVVCGLGVAAIGKRVPQAAPLIGGAIAVVTPVARFRSMDRHHNRLVRDYGSEILRVAPHGALLLTRGDLITNSVRYLHVIQRRRPDVHVVDLELLGFRWYARRQHAIVLPRARYAPGARDGFTLAQLLDANYGRVPILLCGGPRPGDRSADARYGLWPFGLCEEVRVGTEPVNVERWIAQSQAALPRIDFRGQARPRGSWEAVVWSDYWDVRQNRAAQLLEIAGADPARKRFIDVAAHILERVVRESPNVPGHVYKNLAIALGRDGLTTPERRREAAAAWRKYLETAPRDDPERPAIEREIERLNAAPP